jgi:hypothetical protein
MLNFCGIVISTNRHFQNGRHNTAKIQHCPISSKFDMWVDNDVPNWLPTLKKFYRSPFSKWPPQYRTNSTLSNFNDISYVGILWCSELIPHIIIYPHMKCRWNRTMLNLCGIVVAILKMVTGRNFSMWGINSEHHNIPTYEMSLKLDNVEFVRFSSFFLWHMNLTTGDLRNYWTEFHETWWSYRYMIVVDPKVFSFVVMGVTHQVSWNSVQ